MAIANCRLDLKNSYLTRFFAFNHDEFVIILRYANTKFQKLWHTYRKDD